MRMKDLSYGIVSLLMVTGLCGCGGSSGSGGVNSTIVTVTFTGSPKAVATQIGSGSYTKASLNSSNQLVINVPDGTSNYSFAYVCNYGTIGSDGYVYELIVQATIKDGTSFSYDCTTPTQTTQTGTITGSFDVSAIPGSWQVDAQIIQDDYWWYWANSVTSNPVQSFSFQAPTGSQDVVVYDMNQDIHTTLAVKEFTQQTVPGQINGGNLIVFGPADQTTPVVINYNNAPAGSFIVNDNWFTTAGGNTFALGDYPTSTYAAVPASLLTGNAMYRFTSAAISGNNPTDYLVVETLTNATGPLSVTFPDQWNCPTLSAVMWPTFNFSGYTGFSGKQGVLMSGYFDWIPDPNDEYAVSFIAYPDALTNSQFVTPNLNSVSGHFPVPPSGEAIYANEAINQYSSGTVFNLPVNSTLSTVECYIDYTTP
jgi:hypothetical protein